MIAFPKIHHKVLEAVQKRDPKARPQEKLKRHTHSADQAVAYIAQSQRGG